MFSQTHILDTWQFWCGFIAYMVLAIVGNSLSKKKGDPIESAILRFKFISIGFIVLIFTLLLSLPPTGIWGYRSNFKLELFEEVAEYQRQLGLDMNRLREIFYWLFLFLIIWGNSLFNFLKVLSNERGKKSD